MLQKRTLFTAWTILGLFFFCLSAKAQNPNKKTLGHEELVSWNRITQSQISHDGKWLMYNLNPEEGDPTLIIRDLDKERDFTFERTSKGHFSTDNAYAVFLQSPPQDSLKALRRQKVKEDKLPKDTLVIFELATRNVRKIARVKSYQLPAKWPGWLAYHMEPAVPEKKENESDSTKVAEVKKENKKNGSKLFMLQLGDTSAIELGYVSSYLHADEAPGWLAQSTGDDSLLIAGLYYFAGSGDEWIPVYTDTLAKFGDMALSKQGGQAAFLTHSDTTEAQIPPFEVHYWKPGMNKTTLIADSDSDFVPEEWIVSSNRKPAFSEDGSRLFFGLSPKPVLQDTSLLPEEIVQVEVWHWNDERLYPQQMERLKEDKARSWLAVYHIEDQKAHFLQPEAMDNLLTADEGNARYAVAYDQSPYYKMVSWEGFPSRRDLLLVDLDTGTKTKLAEGVKGSASLSPKGKYAYWFSSQDTIWKGIRLADQAKINWTDNSEDPVFYQEEHDTPSVPWSYGIGAWMENDAAFLLYDRFDIWYVDPAAPGNKRRLTRGREKETSYRYIQLDRDKRFLKADETILLRTFSETDKTAGFAWLDLKTGKITEHHFRQMYADRRPQKARDADRYVFSLENFQTFPDLHISGKDFSDHQKVTNANPQQEEYSWGSIELYNWTSLDGNELEGMLVKPENFDPNKKYPMIVNFYEKSSDGLHRHRAPFPGRSTINYSFYASRGYLIFNPDVPYREGYPGESAYNSVVAGVTSLIDEGFVDAERIGVQGHSWGGYQVAYLITKTDIFRCAESGAPVVNMTSAYGGIRWGSGLSRMFQYEHTQSRIGGTLWDKPLRYLENSPLFFTDKINTPVLILHNDKDGAVPWYQGIEWFVALRRLDKPAWMLNYNDEPHWPVKLQNRKDFNIRMAQFFDYYLKDAPQPQWMERGLPAVEKGILQGLD